MDDLQLNVTVAKPVKHKPKNNQPDIQFNKSDYRFKSKPDFTGRILARKRPQHVGKTKAAQSNSGEPQLKKPRQSDNPPDKSNLASKLRDLSENKGKFLGRNYQEINDELQIKQKPTGAWHSSLFKNNPDVPRIGQKAVKPLVEKIFAGNTFADLKLHPHSVANLKQNLNLTELMTVQQNAIPVILQGRDVLIRSQTGSGKTLAYALPIIDGLQAIRPKINRHDGVRVVVIVPTRELAVQTYELFDKLVKPFIWIVPGLLSGGQKRKAEKARLRKGLSILVGTPGRINDHLRHTHSLNFAKTGCLILDEADRLLDMGYEKDVAAIVKAIEDHKKAATYDPIALVKQSVKKNIKDTQDTPEQITQNEEQITSDSNVEHPLTKIFSSQGRQTILLSATLTKAVENLAGLTMTDPVFVDTSEGKMLVADSLNKNKQVTPISTHQTVDIDASQSGHNKVKEKPILTVKEETEPSLDKDEINDKEVAANKAEMRGKLCGFNGLLNSQLYLKENSPNPQDNKIVTSEKPEEQSDSDSDYEYFKVQKEIESKKKQDKPSNDNKDDEMTNEELIENNTFATAVKSAVTEDELILPATVNQTFLVVPMKLRLVTLCSLIVEHCVRNRKGGKMIVFMATLEMVDYHSDLIKIVLTGKKVKKRRKNKDVDDSDESESDYEIDYEAPEGNLMPVDLQVFSLHGSMPHERRMEVFQQFRTAKRGVMICTDVAARGLDVPRVDLVLQYCAPASATDYVHRVGRTGRAAQVGAAILFLLPSEAEFVRHLELKRIRLRQSDESKALESLRIVAPSAPTMQRAAIAVQSRLEYLAHSSKEWLSRASRAYTSWVRFYSGYPRDVRVWLDPRQLHLGHAAKAFALRETPGALAKRAKLDPKFKKEKPNNRLSVKDEEEKKRPGFPKVKVSLFGNRMLNKQSSMHTASEFDSGLPPVDSYTKKKKIQ